MEYRDKSLVCIECHQSFIWTAGEQLFYHDKNFKNEPKRCKDCKAKRSARMGQPAREDAVGTGAMPPGGLPDSFLEEHPDATIEERRRWLRPVLSPFLVPAT